MAANPQLVQSYAAKDYDRNRQLILGISKYSLYLMAILSAPVLYFTHTLLTFWLGDHLPQYTEQTCTSYYCLLINQCDGRGILDECISHWHIHRKTIQYHRSVNRSLYGAFGLLFVHTRL